MSMALTDRELLAAIKGVVSEVIDPKINGLYTHISSATEKCAEHRAELVAMQIKNATANAATTQQLDALLRASREDLAAAEKRLSRKPPQVALIWKLLPAGVAAGIVAAWETIRQFSQGKGTP